MNRTERNTAGMVATIILAVLLAVVPFRASAAEDRVILEAEALADAILKTGEIIGQEFSATTLLEALRVVAEESVGKPSFRAIGCTIRGELRMGQLAKSVPATEDEAERWSIAAHTEIGLIEEFQEFEFIGSRLDKLILAPAPVGRSRAGQALSSILHLRGEFTLIDCTLEQVDVRRTVISRGLYLDGCEIEGSLTIDSCPEVSYFSLQDSNCLGLVKLENSQFEKTRFFGDEFRGGLSLAGSRFVGSCVFQFVTVQRYADLENTQFSSSHDASEAYWVAYRAWEAAGDRHQSDFYFLRHKRAERAGKPRAIRVAELIFVDLVSAYGRSWLRVLITWFVVIFASTVLLWSCRGIEDSDGKRLKKSLDLLLLAFYFSVVTFTTLGYGDYRPHGAFKAVAVLLSLVGSFMLALFVVVFMRAFG